MKEGWTYKKLGEVCDFEGGSQPPKSEWINHPQDGYVRMLQIRDFTKSRNAEIEYVKITKKLRLCKADDILIGRYGASVGKILTGLAGAYNVAIIKSIPDENIVRKEFIRRYFESPLFQSILFKVCTSRAAQAGFSKDDIKDELIPIPSLSDQQSIVDYLDSAFAKIDTMKANAEKALNEAKALFQASLKEMLEPKEGWEKKTIEHFAKIVHGRNQKDVLDGNGLYPIYGSGGNIMGYANAYLCDEGTTILGRKGTIDNPLFINVKFWNVDTAFGIIAKNNCDKKFLYYSIKKIDWAKRNTGTTLPSLTQNVVYNVEMCAPDLSEQQTIVATLDSLKSKVDRLQENFDKISQECDALKQAILRQVFD